MIVQRLLAAGAVLGDLDRDILEFFLTVGCSSARLIANKSAHLQQVRERPRYLIQAVPRSSPLSASAVRLRLSRRGVRSSRPAGAGIAFPWS